MPYVQKKERKSKWLKRNSVEGNILSVNKPDEKGRVWAQATFCLDGQFILERVAVKPGTQPGPYKGPLMVGVSGVFIPQN